MKSLSLSEASQITDIFSAALQTESEYNVQPISALCGYDVFDIDSAIKLQIANTYLLLADNDEAEEAFSSFVSTCETLPEQALTFVPDEEIEKVRRLSPDSPEFLSRRFQLQALSINYLDSAGNHKDARVANLETISSFANYCRQLNPQDALFWQKVYTRIELEYNDESPRGNIPELMHHSRYSAVSGVSPNKRQPDASPSKENWIAIIAIAAIASLLLAFGPIGIQLLGGIVLGLLGSWLVLTVLPQWISCRKPQ